ncbi:hypothetical protein V1514DRAFT_332937 [Lipomyces japonicus]|uniref:uncharacterized protein n=1 Tax=Lipomyces japonicus TaxID=56871 RepID=UPI0034CD7DB5
MTGNTVKKAAKKRRAARDADPAIQSGNTNKRQKTTPPITAAPSSPSSTIIPNANTSDGKRQTKSKKSHYDSRITIKKSDWSYIYLEAILDKDNNQPAASNPQIDVLTWYFILSSAFSRYMGTIGSAFQFDIVHVDQVSSYVRVPSINFKPAWAAVSGFFITNGHNNINIDGGYSRIGLKVIGTSKFLSGLVGPPRKWRPP